MLGHKLVLATHTHGLQGNCGPLPSMEAFNLTGAPLLPAAAPSCLIATDKDLLYAWEGSLWLSNLYVRLKRTPRTDLPIMLHVNRGPAGELWVTDCTFQGDGEDSCRALYSDSSAFLLRTPPAPSCTPASATNTLSREPAGRLADSQLAGSRCNV